MNRSFLLPQMKKRRESGERTIPGLVHETPQEVPKKTERPGIVLETGQFPELVGVHAEKVRQLRIPRHEIDFVPEVRNCPLQRVPHERFDLNKSTILERANKVRVRHVVARAASADLGGLGCEKVVLPISEGKTLVEM